MTIKRTLTALLLTVLASACFGQAWMSAYDKGLKAAGAGDWAAARAAFQQAVAYRPEDASGPTTLPGPVTERREWRNGAPYSPNFLAAYSEYRIALAASNAEDAKPAFQTAAAELEALLAKGHENRETYYFLDQIYARLDDTEKRQGLETRYSSSKFGFRVDDAAISPEELASISGPTDNPKTGTGPVVTIIKPGQAPTTVAPSAGGSNPGVGTPLVGSVPTLATKYALIVGNSASQLQDNPVPFGADDAQAVREALVSNAGYAEANVDLVVNTTKDQLLASAKALADRMPDDGTVFIFFAGNGVNIDGKDYLMGVDSPSTADVSTMIAKTDLYRVFMSKGARIYAFFEVPRPMKDGVYFGKEIPMVGSIAQVQATIPGEQVYSEMRNGHQIGIFANALVTSLQSVRSNRIPIMEFGWEIFKRSRGGTSAMPGSGARQVPTLPVLTHMSDDDRF